MKFINSARIASARRCMQAGMATALCFGFLALATPAPAQDEDIADQIEDRLRPGNTEDPVRENDAGDASDDQFRSRVEDALNGRPAAPDVRRDRQAAPDQDLGQPYYRDAQGRFFFLDPEGGRVFLDQQQQGIRTDRGIPRPQAPQGPDQQGPELGVIITSSPEGIRVDQVQGASVAAEAGIEPGDVLQQVDGQRIGDPRQLQQLVQSMSAGQSVEMTVLRNGEEQTLTATFPETIEGQRHGASKPPMDDDQLQQEVEQLRSEVQALRQQINRLQSQGLNDTGDSPSSPPRPFEQDADQETPDRGATTEDIDVEEESREVEVPELDLSTDDDETDAEVELEAEADTGEAEQLDNDPSTL